MDIVEEVGMVEEGGNMVVDGAMAEAGGMVENGEHGRGKLYHYYLTGRRCARPGGFWGWWLDGVRMSCYYWDRAGATPAMLSPGKSVNPSRCYSFWVRGPTARGASSPGPEQASMMRRTAGK